MLRWAVALAAALALVSGAAGAEAGHPGLNGVIAFDERGTKPAPTRIFTIRPDGKGLRQVTASRRAARSPAWSPDGHTLAYVAAELPGLGPLLVAERGRRPRRLAQIAEEPAWSPDGAEIAFLDFLDSGRVVVVRADGLGRARIVLDEGARRPRRFHGLAWSPDGDVIAVSGSADSLHDACCIFLVPSGGGERRTVLEEPRQTTAEHPIWSPDGRTLAFNEIENCRGRTCSGPVHVALVDRDGRNRRRLLTDAAVKAWSPDGRFLLVDLFRPPGGLQTLNLSNGARGSVVYAENVSRADWQPRCHRLGNGRGNRLRGDARAELVCGLGGADAIDGGQGSDRLLGGRGNDTIDARDGEFDVVGCGAGRDVVRADPDDRIGVDCERVLRRLG